MPGKNTYLGISQVAVNNKTLGYVVSIKKYQPLLPAPVTYDLLLILLSVIGIFLINFGLLFLPLKKRIENNTQALLDFISQKNIEDSSTSPITIEEYQTVAKKFVDEHNQITTLQLEKSYYEARKNIAEQVAHDIRSPLAAINTATADISAIPESHRILIKNASKRINDIANNLLMRSKIPLTKVGTMTEGQDTVPELIFIVLENILAEKHYEYHNKKIMQLNVADSAHNGFAVINLMTFKRVLSNLINNSVESLKDEGLVTIDIECTEKTIDICITDNGCGIPVDILPKITEQGFSFGKEGGGGLGLYHAKQEIQRLQGDLSVRSQENVGTIVSIQLPRCHPPSWFCDSLVMHDNVSVVILDDDPSIYEAWKEKLSRCSNAKLIHFSKYVDLTHQKICELKADKYFIDYELLSSTHNGLDVIESLKINHCAHLVTSCFEDGNVRSRAEKMGVKIIPKSYVPYLPIHVTSNPIH